MLYRAPNGGPLSPRTKRLILASIGISFGGWMALLLLIHAIARMVS